MENMKRIDVLKGIEQILVQKAYETGHISHRADGDWQKQADGSWIPYTGQSTQSAPQSESNNQSQNYDDLSDEEKDRYFNMALQYKNEWAEDSDEEVREMAERDAEDIARMLWEDQKEDVAPAQNFSDLDKYIAKLPNTDLAEDSDEEGSYEQDNEDREDMSDEEADRLYDEIVDRVIDRAYELHNNKDDEEDAPDGEDDWDRYDDITDMIQNTDWESMVSEYDNPSVEQIMSDYNLPDDERIRDEISTYIHTDNKEKTVVNPKMDWEGISMSSVDKPAQYILENLEDFEGEDMDGIIKTFIKGAGNREQQIVDATKRYIQREAESNGKKLTWYSDGTYSIEKSAIRDMRSALAVKNMGF